MISDDVESTPSGDDLAPAASLLDSDGSEVDPFLTAHLLSFIEEKGLVATVRALSKAADVSAGVFVDEAEFYAEASTNLDALAGILSAKYGDDGISDDEDDES